MVKVKPPAKGGLSVKSEQPAAEKAQGKRARPAAAKTVCKPTAKPAKAAGKHTKVDVAVKSEVPEGGTGEATIKTAAADGATAVAQVAGHDPAKSSSLGSPAIPAAVSSFLDSLPAESGACAATHACSLGSSVPTNNVKGSQRCFGMAELI